MSSHKGIRKLAKWLLAAATVLVALLLIWQCADIYRVGTSAANQGANGVRIADIYSREIVGERFGRISWSVWIWLVLFIVSLFLRSDQTAAKEKFSMRPSDQLKLLLVRKEKTQEMLANEKKRKMIVGIVGVVCIICSVGAIWYLTRPASFASRDLEPVMGQMMLHVVPWVVVAFAAVLIGQNVYLKLIKEELELAKKAPAKAQNKQDDKQVVSHANKQIISRLIVLALAVVFIVAGILNGGMFDVFVKAINICTECIGLG